MTRLILFCLLVIVSCNSEIKLAGNIVKTPSSSVKFKGVSINDEIHLILTQDTARLEITADENIISHVLYFVEDDILNIYLDPSLEYPKSTFVKVVASNPIINYVNAHDRVRIDINDTILSKNFQMHISNNSIVNCDSLVSNLFYARIDASSVLNIGGNVKKALFTISDNSDLNARYLITDTTAMVVYSGSEATVSVLDSLSVDISRASKVGYYGNADLALTKKIGENSVLVKLN